MLMEKSIVLGVSLILGLACKAADLDERKQLLASHKNKALGITVLHLGTWLAYDLYSNYQKETSTNLSLEKSPLEQGSEDQEDQPRQPLTWSERCGYFCKGVGYSLLTGASILATDRCALYFVDRVCARDEQRVLLERPRRVPLTQKKREELLAAASKLYRTRMGEAAVSGPLMLAIPYMSYYKYRLPHLAVEHMKKAFQS